MGVRLDMNLVDQRTLLVVEDSDDDFFAMQRAFSKAGMHNPVRRCTNGDQAVDYLFRRGEFSDPANAPRPCTILLDLNLPGLDGRDVLHAVKSNPVTRPIPVIVLTTSDAQSDIQRCYEAGANSFIQKPVDAPGFLHALAQLTDCWLEIAVLPEVPERRP